MGGQRDPRLTATRCDLAQGAKLHAQRSVTATVQRYKLSPLPRRPAVRQQCQQRDSGIRLPPSHTCSDPMADSGYSYRPVSESAAIHLRRIAQKKAFSSPRSATEALTAAFEAEDYLECVKDLTRCGIDPGSYINGLDEVSLDQDLG